MKAKAKNKTVTKFVPLHMQKGRPGRPPLGDKARRFLHVRMDPWIMDQLETLRDHEDVQMTAIVEAALEQFLAARGVRRMKLRIRRSA